MSPINEGSSAAITAELFRASGLTLNSSTDTVTAGTVNAVTGLAGVIDVSQIANGLLVVSVGVPTGSSPQLGVFVDVQDGLGNWVLVSNAAGISGALLGFSGVVYGNISNGYQLTSKARIRWTVSAGASFPSVSLSLWGR